MNALSSGPSDTNVWVLSSSGSWRVCSFYEARRLILPPGFINSFSLLGVQGQYGEPQLQLLPSSPLVPLEDTCCLLDDGQTSIDSEAL